MQQVLQGTPGNAGRLLGAVQVAERDILSERVVAAASVGEVDAGEVILGEVVSCYADLAFRGRTGGPTGVRKNWYFSDEIPAKESVPAMWKSGATVAETLRMRMH